MSFHTALRTDLTVSPGLAHALIALLATVFPTAGHPNVPLDDATLAVPALIGLLTGTGGMVAVLGPYTAQSYPTAVRGLGNGLSAACTKSGGIIGPPLIGTLVASQPLGRVAVLVAVPVALSTAALARWGRETSAAAPADPETDADVAADAASPVPIGGATIR
ncbi:hypothetical protein [Streptomyces toxytricini]|uniref:hypothetical protein n=1 Tax=Streptomyces toxytricini TaxID=67369 RepID=UPI00341E0AD8